MMDVLINSTFNMFNEKYIFSNKIHFKCCLQNVCHFLQTPWDVLLIQITRMTSTESYYILMGSFDDDLD